MKGTTSLLPGCRAVNQAPGNYVKLMPLTSVWKWLMKRKAKRDMSHSDAVDYMRSILKTRSQTSGCGFHVY